MTEILELLKAEADEKYAAFQAKLVPNVPRERIMGVRSPALKKIAKSVYPAKEFIAELPHAYYDEDMLHSAVLSLEKDCNRALSDAEDFLPYIDNWAVCDTLSPKAFAKNPEAIKPHLEKWLASEHTYTARFALNMLMAHFLEERFDKHFLELAARAKSGEYYINMGKAWFFATALAKQWDETVKYLENNVLDVWTHNKTIQKARESFRVSDEHKEYLTTLKRR